MEFPAPALLSSPVAMRIVLIPTLVLGLASCSRPAAPAGAPPVVEAAARKPVPKPYPLERCLVTDDDLDEMDERVATVHEGQVFEFCCKPCLRKFHKNPGKYVKRLAKVRGGRA